ncbi:ATP-binding cassette sub-family F member 1 [Hondaea fermentalgiana]|uniref:ATP-binding cassette sub-family F member 1 n=1 Tax=Hondaea fermentalgiana TaxID=2315210 RepID=A0A2R5G1D9_9STRA|nr:ATP-binding cassette sub-family F member 1 [Hondaea fermentalgiana]|eukprot:GBG24109.1 ATP-binding cassette sub-family F member 1 [Hondaea fermentalgiana]
MGKGKKKGGRKNFLDDLDTEAQQAQEKKKEEQAQEGNGEKLSRKQKRMLKLAKKGKLNDDTQSKKTEDDDDDNDDDDDDNTNSKSGGFGALDSEDDDDDNDDDDDEEEDEAPQPKAAAAGFGALDDSEDEEDEEEAAPAPKSNKSKKQSKKDKKKQKAASAGGFGALDMMEDSEDEAQDENDDDDAGQAATSFAALNMDDDDDDEEEEEEDDTKSSKSKKSKKEKKEKKKKKEKSSRKSRKGGSDEDQDDEDANDDDADEASSKSKKSSKSKSKSKDDDSEGDAKKGRGKKGKLSNKERRKLKEAQEADERERLVSEIKSKPTEFAVSATAINRDDAWENGRDINIPSFTVSAYGKTLFQNAELKIAENRKYGLIGRNGGGKSTLLRLIANGELEIPPKIDTIYVDQEVPADDTPAVDMVLQADTRRTQLLKREEEVMAILDREEADDMSMEEHEALFNELSDISNELRLRNSDAAEAKALTLLTGLGFTQDMLRAPTKSFSGGWRMRVSIARALFLERTLTLLDEPSNHLDLNSAIYLTDVLQKWKKTIILVSHDSSLLEAVCTDIMCLADLSIQYYRGTYSQFEDQHKIYLEKIKKEYEKQEKELRSMKKKGVTNKKAAEQLAAKKKREGGGARKKKGAGGDDDAGGNIGGSLADRQLLQRPKDYVVNFDFPEPEIELQGNYISVEDVAFKYPGGKTLFKKLSFGIDKDSRITIVGANGIGKSTLMKLFVGDLEPTKGEVKINRGVRIAKYHQHFLDVLPAAETPVDFLRRIHNITYQEARNTLGRFGLEGSAHVIKLMNCSGGQKSRVVFANMALQRPSILCLDEPTNHLDLESVEALIDGINNFEGAVILISHDERVIVETECRLWVLENKTVVEWEGGFDEYRDSILEDIQRQEEENRQKMQEKIERAAEERKKKMEEFEKRKKAKAAAAAGGGAEPPKAP